MARSGMVALITQVRYMVNDDESSVWTNDQIQTALDAHRFAIHREPLEVQRVNTSSTTYEYKVYRSRFRNFESGGTAYFQIEASDGTQRGTADYDADYLAGIVTMAADQVGTALYLTGTSYDLNATAADLWQRRAGQVSSRYDITTDGQNMRRSQHMKHCLQMADYYRQQAKPITVRQWTNGAFDSE